MDLGIAGKSAIVCALSKVLGKACALALAQAGVTVTVNGRDAESVQNTAHGIHEATGCRVVPVVADLGTSEGRAALLDAVPDPDILVNNNGGPPLRNFRELDRAAILEGVAMNMATPIELIQAVIDAMAGRNFGRIVNITSLTVKMPVAGLDLSSGARAGLSAFVAGIARDIADRNVTVNNILPGYFETDRLTSALEGMGRMKGMTGDEVAAGAKASIPARRFGRPEEFGKTCAFLCSTAAGFITGQNIVLDGGQYPSAF
jgi:3-oxoacyl-[acyl-carrier protein] reductase